VLISSLQLLSIYNCY